MVARFRCRVLQRRFALRGHDFEAVRVEDALEVAPVFLRFGFGKEAIVEAALGVDGVCRADPVDGAFDFAASGGSARLAVEIGRASCRERVSSVV